MLRNVFLKTLRDQRRSFIYWSAGVALLTIITILFYPAIREAPELSEVFAEAEVLAEVFAGGFTDLTSPEGYLNSQLFSLMVPLLLAIFAIASGSGAIAGEEERGTLDVLLSYPTTRSKVLLQKAAAMLAATLALGLVLWATLLISAPLVDMDVSIFGTAQVTFSAVLFGLLFGYMSLALGSATGRRGLSIGATGGIAIGTFLLNSLSPLVDGMEAAQYISPMYYYIDADPLANGLDLLHAAVLAVTSTILVAVAVFTLQRRDLAV